MNRTDIKNSVAWLIRFAGWGMVFFLLSGTALLNRMVGQYYTPLLIKISSMLIGIIGVDHDVTRQTFVTGTQNFTISESCTGIFVFFLLATAILSFPVSWKSRCYGILTGFLALSILNIIRIIMIVSIGRQFAGSFWSLHVLFGQFIVIAGIAAFFVLWLHTTAPGSRFSGVSVQNRYSRQAIWFVAGYGVSMIFYQYFLSSRFGEMISNYVQKHSYLLINRMAAIFTHWFSAHPVPSFGFNEGCLSSPIIVILMAVVISMPWRWRTRIIILLVGFVPVFYGYHVIRAVLTAISFSFGASKNTSVVYNCYGQFILAGLGLVTFWYSIFRQQNVSSGMVARKILTGVFSGSIAAFGGGWVFLKVIVPWISTVTGWISADFYDVQLTISTMPYFQYFILFSLIGSDRSAITEKIKPAIYGIILVLAFMTALLGGIEILDLSPHMGILKTVIVVIPFVVYYYVKPSNR